VRVVLVLLAGSLACGPTPPPTRAVPSAPVSSSSPASSSRSPAAAAPAGDTELGVLVTEQGAKPEDYVVVIRRGEDLEINGGRMRVGRGDVELGSDRTAVSRDAEGRYYVREITSRTVPLGRSPAALSIGDRATSGDWEVRWLGIRDGLVLLEGTHRKKRIEEWKALLERRPSHELASADRLFHFEVQLTAVSGDPARPSGSISITGDTRDHAAAATFGQPLAPGLYTFPDGLRMRVEQIASCDFDTSVPCFGGTYRADAVFRGEEAHIEWRTKTTKALGHAIELANFKIIVRK
jgi:hypothetical protein